MFEVIMLIGFLGAGLCQLLPCEQDRPEGVAKGEREVWVPEEGGFRSVPVVDGHGRRILRVLGGRFTRGKSDLHHGGATSSAA